MTDSKTLRNWRACRSGVRVTVSGTNVTTGHQDKITKVVELKPAGDQLLHIVAVDADAVEHRLLFA